MKANLSIISFMDCAFGVVAMKTLPNSQSPRFSFVLFSRNVTVLNVTFRSMIPFELIFVKGGRSVSRFFIFFFFLHVFF